MRSIFQTVLVAVIAIVAFQLGRWTVSSTPKIEREDLTMELIDSLKQPDWLERTHRYSGLVQELSAGDMDPFLAALEEGSVELTPDEFRLLLHSWTRFDPKSAFQYALFSEADGRRQALGEVVYAWAYRDPAGAQVALLGLQNTDLEKFLVGQLVGGWSRGASPAQVQDYVEGMPEGPVRDAAIGHLAQVIRQTGTGGLKDWAERLASEPTDSMSHVVFVKAASILARDEPAETAEWVASHFGSDYASGAARAVARRWVELDPTTAFEWLGSLPASDERREATEFIFAYWLKNRPGVAEAWLADAVPAIALDPAMEFMARSKLQSDPTVAIKWARHIADPGTRERILVKVASHWYRSDPVAAARWLKQSALPRAARNAILGAAQ